MTALALADVQSLLDAPSPAVLTTTRADGSAVPTPVWYRWTGDAFEIVIARGDPKLRHLAGEPRCSLLIFEVIPPFRGIEIRGDATLEEGDMTEARRSIAGRYLGMADGERFAAARVAKPGVLLRLAPGEARVWSLEDILPPDQRADAT